VTNVPQDWKDHPIQISAWFNFIEWAFLHDEMREQFEEETGTSPIVIPAKGGLAALIDEACGIPKHNKTYMKKFIIWATETYWSDDEKDIPSIFYEKFKEQTP
jgi:hypothetical protein